MASVGDVFKALADPTRRTILDELADRNGQTLFEICARLTTKHGLGSSRQAISQHFDVLDDAGLVQTRREGRYKFHYLDTTPLELGHYQSIWRWGLAARPGSSLKMAVFGRNRGVVRRSCRGTRTNCGPSAAT